ncbi:MAG: SAM-dependent methyltransferase [Lachnospiraceae bacterium]|nr:SAM-dependent methyltransferase [Lachnospiraceae bacterium]
MNRYNLSKRLKKVDTMVEPAAFLADIGCDHGFLSIDLVKSGKVKKALCTDINEGPLKRAEEHIKEYGLEGKINTCLSDGLLSLKNKFDDFPFDSAVICGMGGIMGIKIIHEAVEFFRRMNVFYLQLQSDIELVRLYLKKNGFKIVYEDMVLEDGKYYTVMKVINAFHESNPKDNEEGTEKEIGNNIKDNNVSGTYKCLFDGVGFDTLPLILKEQYDKTDIPECVDLKYPYYEGMDDDIYESFLLFLINKYETIMSYLPDNSDRLPVINKELKIMNLAYERYKSIKV